MGQRLIEIWKKASEDLGIKIQVPFTFQSRSCGDVKVDVLVENFGGKRGTLVVTDFNLISDCQDLIVREGYGYSTLSEPGPNSKYEREDFIEMLREWSWTGIEKERPIWCTPWVEEDD